MSEKEPFIFFHQRKAGGTSIRENLHKASRKLDLKSFIPCYNQVKCNVYSMGHDQAYALYAGHFKWGMQSDLARFHASARESFSCASNFREPASRMESCLYFRFGAKLGERCLNDIPLSEFTAVLDWVDEFGQSCLNEPFRVLSGEADEVAIDQLFPVRFSLQNDSTAYRSTSQPMSLSALAVVNNTLAHTLRCTPIILELPESYLALSRRIPMLGKLDAFSTTTHSNMRGMKCPPLSSERKAMIKEKVALESILYRTIYEKVKGKISENAMHPLLSKCGLWNASSISGFVYKLNDEKYSNAFKEFRKYNPVVEFAPCGLLSMSESPLTKVVIQVIEGTTGLEINRDMIGGRTDPSLIQNSSIVHMSSANFQISAEPHFRFNTSLYSCKNSKTSDCQKKQILSVLKSNIVLLRDPFLFMYENFFANFNSSSSNEKGLLQKLQTLNKENQRNEKLFRHYNHSKFSIFN